MARTVKELPDAELYALRSYLKASSFTFLYGRIDGKPPKAGEAELMLEVSAEIRRRKELRK